MKRPHRRIHLLVWLILTPLTALTAFLFWTMRPQTPYGELPPGIETAPKIDEAH